MSDTRPPRVIVLTGGPTLEYKSSLDSALGILSYRDQLREEYQLEPCFITHSGIWLDAPTSEKVLEQYKSGKPEDTVDAIDKIALNGHVTPWQVLSETAAVFLTICGAFGEDGAIIGLCQAMRKPHIGSSIFTSVVQYDKAACNALLKSVGISQTPQVVLLPGEPIDAQLAASLPLPWVVKPSYGGCSIGISFVRAMSELPAAILKSQEYYFDSPILIEAAVENALEVDVAVMRDLDGNIVVTPCGMFATPDQKQEHSAALSTIDVPASGIPQHGAEKMRDLAKRVYQVLRGTGWLKIDFFYQPSTGIILVNEINAVPNMSRDSLNWRLWEAAGIGPLDMIRRLIKLALREGLELENHEKAKLLQRSLVGRGRIRVG